ncbi:MAG: twin-arginine translocase TatA/TatE family subunit [Ilumatobacteraceae bacterium]
MFNLSGSELVFLLLIALVVLGPEKLPEAVRKFGKVYGEFKKMSTGFQSEMRSVLEEPMREMRDTADALRKAANIDFEPDRVDPGSTQQPTPATPVEKPQPVESVTPTEHDGPVAPVEDQPE